MSPSWWTEAWRGPKVALAASLVLVAGACGGSLSQSPAPVKKTVAVEAEGEAAIIQGDVPHAKDEAILVAKKRAAEQHVGAFVTAKTRVENGVLISQHIDQRVGAFVTGAVVVDEENRDGIYRVKIVANVVTGEEMEKELIQLARRSHNVAVRIEEKNLDEPLRESYVGNAVTEQMVRAGYRVVDPGLLGELRGQWERLRAANDPAAARALGSRFLVQYLITGTASSRESKNDLSGFGVSEENMIPFARARASVRVISSETAEIVCTAGSDMTRGVSSNSLPEAGREALRHVAGRVAGRLAEEDCIPDQVREIVLEVDGIPNYTEYQRFLSLLKALRFSAGAAAEGFRARERSVFRATYEEDVGFLASRIGQNPRYEVLEVGSRRVRARYVPEPATQ